MSVENESTNIGEISGPIHRPPMTTKHVTTVIILTVVTLVGSLNYLLINPRVIKLPHASRRLSDGQTTTEQRPQLPPPEVALLMSFPNSGTTYTQRLVQETSLTTAATFYGTEFVGRQGNGAFIKQSRPVYDGVLEGPFRLSHLPLPKGGYIMTKTHCGGYGFSDVQPRGYMMDLDMFMGECAHGARTELAEKGKEPDYHLFWFFYDLKIIKKAVHIFRNPFDNIVSRFHHEIHMNERNSPHLHWKVQFKNDADGFRQWCQYFDERKISKEKELVHPGIWRAFEGVPCHGEFYRYVQWHNHAFAGIGKLGVETHVVYYEDYGGDKKDETIDGLLGFLGLERATDAKVPLFRMQRYPTYYNADERRRIVGMFQELASPETWQYMKRYVEGWVKYQ